MKSYILVVAFCALAVIAQDSFDSSGVRLILKIYDECANSDGFSPCLKKKAITFLDRVARMDKLALIDGITLVKSKDAASFGPQVSENEIEQNLPRSTEGKDEALNEMIANKFGNLLGSRTIEISMPTISEMIEEGRKGDGGGGGFGGGGGGGGGGGKGGKMKNMMGGMMMAVAAKMAALIPLAIAGLFLLAGKALITAKIALMISGIIALKKIFASKQGGGGGGGGGGHGGWSSGGGGGIGGGGGGGWQSSGGGGGGGGWDKRSIDVSQQLAYKAYKQP